MPDNNIPDQGRVQGFEIFISHRMEDRKIAEAIRDGLQAVTKKIVVHVCTKNQGDQDWRNTIENAIKISNMMIFLFTVDQEEAWRWCMYEIGWFKGLAYTDDKRKLICLKNVNLTQLPSPIQACEPYEADLKGVKKFCKHLLYKRKYCDSTLADVNDSEVRENVNDAVKGISHHFELSRIEHEYYDRRITIDLPQLSEDEGTIDISKSTVSGDVVTMERIFNFTGSHQAEDSRGKKIIKTEWPNLYRKFEKKDQTEWLERIKGCIKKVENQDYFQKVLTPFSVLKNGGKELYIPVISSVEKIAIEPKEAHTKKYAPKKINVIFIRQSFGRKFYLETFPTLIPCSKVKVWLETNIETGEKKLQENENGEIIEPRVLEMNEYCLQLYNLRRDEFEDNRKHWTGAMLIERLRRYNFVEEENIHKLETDQSRLMEDLVLKGFNTSEAYIPLQFNDHHPLFKNSCFLPVLISIQTEGDTSAKHVAYLLVAYVKDFWPPDHENNQFNKIEQ